MVSSRNDGGSVDEVLQKKIMVSGRVPEYIMKYARDRKITIAELIEAGFDRYRESDVAHAFERLRYHEECVLHWKGIVLQTEHECNTKVVFCNTVRDEFKKQGRGHPQSRRLDKNWLVARAKKAQTQGLIITVDELYEYCIKKEENVKEAEK